MINASKKPRRKLEGTTIGKWAIVEYLGDCHYLCKCECGIERKVLARSLMNGDSSSCGCNAVAQREEKRTREREYRKVYVPSTRFEPSYE